MTIADACIVGATLAGPVLAVQAQKWLERAAANRERKHHVFRVLMATRGLRAASTEHVQALNLIDLYFRGNSANEKAVREAWHTYLDHLKIEVRPEWSEEKNQQHNERAVDLLTDLLKTMGIALGFSFEKVDVKNGFYLPQGHTDDNAARSAVVKGLANVLAGQQTIPMAVKEFPVSQDAVTKQLQLQDAIIAALDGSKPLAVTMTPQ